MKSRTAFERTVRKMEQAGAKLFFWTFTYREVHSLSVAMRLWNEFLTILKRNMGFRGVRVLELHDEHGVHFHVITNKRYKIRAILAIGERYGFGRTHVQWVRDIAGGIAYLCKYLSKPRSACLKGVRLWAAFGKIERTRVSDIIVDSPFVRILREAMGSPSPDELRGEIVVPPSPVRRRRRSFIKALPIAWERYLTSFDSEYTRRQIAWQKRRFRGQCDLSTQWFGRLPEVTEG
jgi:hypothetical protein